MDDNEISKILKQQVNEYYHLEDRYEEALEKIDFSKRPKNNILYIPRKPFIFILIFASALTIAATSIISGTIGYNMDNDNSSPELSLYNNSVKEAEKYLKENLTNYNLLPVYNYNIHDLYIFNIYSGKKEGLQKFVYQLKTEEAQNFSIELSCNSYTKTLSYTKDSNENNSQNIGILNDANFIINDSDIMYGKIYIDNVLEKTITINF